MHEISGHNSPQIYPTLSFGSCFADLQINIRQFVRDDQKAVLDGNDVVSLYPLFFECVQQFSLGSYVVVVD